MKLKRNIKGDRWTFEVVTAKAMKKLAGDEDTAGLCVAYEKTIYIREDSVEYAVICHELFHCYFSYLHLSDTNEITLEDSEEICASLIAADGKELIKKAKAITKDLQKLAAEGEE